MLSVMSAGATPQDQHPVADLPPKLREVRFWRLPLLEIATLVALMIGILWDVSRDPDPSSGFATFFLFAPGIFLVGMSMLLSLPLHSQRLDIFWWDLSFVACGVIGVLGLLDQQSYVLSLFLFPGLVGLSVLLRRLIALLLWRRQRMQR